LKGGHSLLLRAALSVLAAFVLVFAMLLAVIGYTTLRRETGDFDRQLLLSARRLAVALDEAQADGDAAAILRVQQRLMAEADPAEPPIHMMLMRQSDGWRSATAGAPILDIATLATGTGRLPIGALGLQVYVADGPHWRVVYVDDKERRTRVVLADIATDLATYLLWALPIMLLPVWFAVRSALAPLKRLAAEVAARRPGDQTPLAPARAYSELQPLVGALNDQFERAAQQLLRERAFVHDAAHELRTPLAVIDAQAHVLATSEGPAREAARRHLEGTVERASHVTQQLLRMAQADALADAPRAPADVMDILRDTLAGFATIAAAQGAELSLSGPDTWVVDTDARALRSVLENLVDNALRYGGQGVKVEVSVATTPGQWTLAVADDGPGIPPSDRERVFERFWRSRTATAQGAGLGLAIVREAVRSWGGEVGVFDGIAGRGCTLRIALPCR
jgi:signal transduction histidine kinase